jgi:hypothetical protein
MILSARMYLLLLGVRWTYRTVTVPFIVGWKSQW